MFEKIAALIAEQLYIEVDDVKEDSSFMGDLGADSLDVVQMLISMEREFGVKFADDEIVSIKTIGDAVKMIENKRK